MSLYFEELDYRPTPIGALSLRRRRELSLGVDVFEIKLGDEYLMSSLFTASEIALARLGLAELSGADLDVVVVLALAIPPKRCSSMRRSSLSSFNLSGAKVTARFSLDDMRGANLSHLRASADMRNQSMGLIRADFSRANLTGANFEGAALGHVNFEFAKLQHTNFSGADLSDADFAGANLTDADLTGANIARVDFNSAVLTCARGLPPH